MPLYEYECEKCGLRFERLMKMDADPPLCTQAIEGATTDILEQCGGETKKLISLNNFHLKGGGWYKDGYTTQKKSE